MSTPHHAIVWIDHQQAKIFRFEGTDFESANVRSSHPHEHIHHKVNANNSGHVSVGNAFLKQVADAVSNAGTILITGPANAKKELAAYLEQKQPGVAARVAGVEALDHPSDGQLVAFARKFFKADERMNTQLRRGMHQ